MQPFQPVRPCSTIVMSPSFNCGDGDGSDDDDQDLNYDYGKDDDVEW